MLLPLLLSALAVVAPPRIDDDSLFSTPGISHALAERRSAQISAIRYALALDVTKLSHAEGMVEIRFRVAAPEDVILDFRGDSLGTVSVNGEPATVEYNHAHIRLPAHLMRAGENRVIATFRTPIAPAGASIIRYHDATDGSDYLYTLLVPADANLLFPCFDQPDLKARVRLDLRVPSGWKTLANGRADSNLGAALPHEMPSGAGTNRWTRFRETRPISTYLIAFAAGPWKTFAFRDGARPIALYVRASRAGEVEADSLLRSNAQALRWLERYFARPYPFDSFAFLLAPAFPFGGMEHPGAIFYNEESFIYREPPTQTQRLGRAATIYHEVAHQWFGDLVTMKWFDDLWLKEGFATYMAAKIQAELDPKSHAWLSFYLRNKPVAYSVDASEGTTPVWQELANLNQAKSNYGAIVYNKAPGILKQLNYLVGERAFRAGLQHYLSRHAYGNATWRDLLGAVGTAGGRSLTAWGEQYILRPGMPIFEQTWRPGDTLRISQMPARPLSGDAPWPARIEVLLGDGAATPQRVPVELSERVTNVSAAAARARWVFANGDDQAYGIVRPDSTSAAWMLDSVGTVADDLTRAMLWGTLWELVRDARLDPSRFARIALREIPGEPNEQLIASLLGRLGRAVDSYVSARERDSLLPQTERLLSMLAADTTRSFGVRKHFLDAFIGIAGTPAALAHLEAVLDSSSVLGIALGKPTRWAIVTTLVAHNVTGSDEKLAAELARDAGSEGKRRAFVAGAAHPDSAIKAVYFARYFGDSTLNEDWVTASLSAFNEPDQEELTLPYLRLSLEKLPWIQQNRRIFFLGSWLGSFLGGQRSAAALETTRGFLSDHPELPRDLRQKILQSSDELERTVKIRQTYP